MQNLPAFAAAQPPCAKTSRSDCQPARERTQNLCNRCLSSRASSRHFSLNRRREPPPRGIDACFPRKIACFVPIVAVAIDRGTKRGDNLSNFESFVFADFVNIFANWQKWHKFAV
jgi:hypothetical protein